MSYFVVVTFDLKDGDSEDYESVYKEFKAIGLSKTIKASDGDILMLPTTATAGEFNGQNAGAVRDDIAARTKGVFTRNNLHGEIFVSVGGDWAWAHRKP